MKYVLLLDGHLCGAGLRWQEAMVDARRLLKVLSSEDDTDDGCVVTVSEQQLGEPRASWRLVDGYWEFQSEPVWSQAA